MHTPNALAVGLAAALTLGLGCTHRAEAAEGGVSDYASGASSPFVGLFPPIPGVFLLTQGFYHPPGHLYGADGKRSPLPVKAGSQGVAERFIIAYPDPVFGAKFYQQIILAPVNVSVKTFGQTDSEFGLGNILVSPLILSWAIGQKQTFTFGLDVVTPFGSFDRNRAVNVGVDHTSVQPVFAYRYLDPEGFTLGVGTRFLFNTENVATRYTNGTAVATDFEVGYSIGNLRLGVVGYYSEQLEDDRQFGRKVPGGNRYRAAGIGPSVTYAFGPVILNVNYQFGVMAENTVRSDTLWVNLAVPLYAAPPPGAPPGTPGPAIPPGSSRAITARR